MTSLIALATYVLGVVSAIAGMWVLLWWNDRAWRKYEERWDGGE